MKNIHFYGKLFDTNDISPAIAKAAHIAAAYGKGLIQARTPVDTGKLKSQWEVAVEGKGLRIANSVPYAGYVEFGTTRMNGRQMMTSSLPDIQGVFMDELSNKITEELGGRSGLDLVKPSYQNAVNPSVVSKVSGGLSKRSSQMSKSYLFSNPAKILSERHTASIGKARPMQGRRG